MQLGNKAVQGDLPSQREFISLARTSEDAISPSVSPLTLHEIDQKVIQNFLQRMAHISAEVKSADPETKGKKSK